MRVICVTPIIDTERGMENAPRPQVGDIDEVIDVAYRYESVYYLLDRFQRVAAFKSTHFATLPDQPEEVIEEPELATA